MRKQVLAHLSERLHADLKLLTHLTECNSKCVARAAVRDCTVRPGASGMGPPLGCCWAGRHFCIKRKGMERGSKPRWAIPRALFPAAGMHGWRWCSSI